MGSDSVRGGKGEVKRAINEAIDSCDTPGMEEEEKETGRGIEPAGGDKRWKVTQ